MSEQAETVNILSAIANIQNAEEYKELNWEGSFDDYLKVVQEDRKSTRLNSSHRCISYAVFCLKKKRGVVRAARGAGAWALERGCEGLDLRERVAAVPVSGGAGAELGVFVSLEHRQSLVFDFL